MSNNLKKWESLYNTVKDSSIGTMFSFNDLKESVGFDIKRNRQTIYRTNKELLKNQKLMLISVHGFGYQISDPQNQLNHAASRKDKARKQLEQGVNEINGLNMKKLSKEDKMWVTHLKNHLQSHIRSLQSIKCKNEITIKNADITMQNAKEVQDDINNQITKMMNELSTLQNKVNV